jgi:hypothetical protein
VVHALHISYSLTSPFQLFLAKGTSFEATHYAVSSNLLPIHFSSVQIISSSVNTIPLMSAPLWSSGQSSWLQIQRSGFNCRHYQIFWEVVGLERGPLSTWKKK